MWLPDAVVIPATEASWKMVGDIDKENGSIMMGLEMQPLVEAALEVLYLRGDTSE